MRMWKIGLACIALIGASMFALAHHGSNSGAANGITDPAAKHTQSQQSTPAGKATEGAKSDSDYGWGPFRTTDW